MFFFKQKTAYEMRISDWSSDVCSSDLGFSVLEVIEMARHVTGHPIPRVVAGRREGDPPKLVADAMLARKELQWRPVHTDLEKIVRDAWSWELRHAEWRRD